MKSKQQAIRTKILLKWGHAYLRPDKDSLNDVVSPVCTLSGLLSVPNSQILPDTRVKENYKKEIIHPAPQHEDDLVHSLVQHPDATTDHTSLYHVPHHAIMIHDYIHVILN
jgi:hypothetical protein